MSLHVLLCILYLIYFILSSMSTVNSHFSFTCLFCPIHYFLHISLLQTLIHTLKPIHTLEVLHWWDAGRREISSVYAFLNTAVCCWVPTVLKVMHSGTYIHKCACEYNLTLLFCWDWLQLCTSTNDNSHLTSYCLFKIFKYVPLTQSKLMGHNSIHQSSDIRKLLGA